MRFTATFTYLSTQQIILSERVKATPCKFCKKRGYIKSHGKLKGVHATNPTTELRGIRFFCSDRYSNAGCGRTISILFNSMVSRCTVRVKHLTELFNNLLSQGNLHAAWNKSRIPFSLRSAYRWLNKIQLNQAIIRSNVYQSRPTVELENLPPIEATIHYLKSRFPDSEDCIEAYQERFQSPIFTD